MKLLFYILLGITLGLLAVVLLPFLFVVALQWFIISTREPADISHRRAADTDAWIDDIERQIRSAGA